MVKKKIVVEQTGEEITVEEMLGKKKKRTKEHKKTTFRVTT